MPREGITAYDLLVSCPSDVEEYLEVIKEGIGSFNRYFGSVNKIAIVPKHWSTDSYPQSGDKPQELLNKQFVRDCDAAVAVFWTRFGTPTDKYGSGTEEEIEEMLSAGKQVFMYFLDAPVNLSKVNIEQYNQVVDFRDKYKDKGIYATIADKEQFKKEFTNHLALHFMPLIIGKTNINDNQNLKPRFLLKNAKDEDDEVIKTINTNLHSCKLIVDMKGSIINKILMLNNQILHKRTQFTEQENYTSSDSINSNYKYIRELVAKTFPVNITDADFQEERIEKIKKFADENKIIINDGFFNVGNLKKSISLKPLFYDSGISYEGSDEEKKRFESLEDLYWDVLVFNEYLDYFLYFDSNTFISLAVSNVGNTYDEDIDVKLFIKKNSIIKLEDFPYPGISIIDKLLGMNFINSFFEIHANDKTESYGYYPIKEPVYEDMLPGDPFNQRSVSEEYQISKEKYRKSLKRIFCYKIYENDDYDIVMIHIDYLKHNTSMAFPSVLLFNIIPEYIEYEIKSKYIPDLVKGRIQFNNKK